MSAAAIINNPNLNRYPRNVRNKWYVLSWLVFQIDMALLLKENGLNEGDLKRLQYSEL